MRDPRFTTGDLARLTAAVAGISRSGWESLTADAATEDCAKVRMAERRFDVLPIETAGHPSRSRVREPGALSKLSRRVQRVEEALETLRRSLTAR